ncbi:GNAT family N-acetyltransferase [Microbispora amethystogenes]|uniref:GNAT family N-acetyltransferase n=1 Tax=Microbispora amethystogenes TaxID=1427754 RepID=UPI0033D1C879
MRPIPSVSPLAGENEVAAASGDDDLVMWAAQGMRPGVHAWAYGDAVAVASPALARRDRLVVKGEPARVVPLLRHALAEAGPAFRPLGEATLLEEVVRAAPELELAGHFTWMTAEKLAPPRADAPDVAARAPGRSSAGARPVAAEAAWLEPAEEPEVAALLAAAHPRSYAVPGLPGVRRWAGIRDGAGALLAVAADAWSAPSVGLLAGVATSVPARGHGLGERVCRFAASALLDAHGRAALMVDDWNAPAIAVYERLGFARRGLGVAALRR